MALVVRMVTGIAEFGWVKTKICHLGGCWDGYAAQTVRQLHTRVLYSVALWNILGAGGGWLY